MSAPANQAAPTASRPAPVFRRIMAQGLYETRKVLGNGEQLLVTLVLPLLVLVGLNYTQSLTDVVPGIQVLTPGVLALAVMASAFTGQAIATGFERQYGALAFLATTPLGTSGLILGKAVAVLGVMVLQVVILGGVGLALGWSPEPVGLIWLAVAMLLGAWAFTALGLLMAGALRAEATLALSNVAWVLMGAVGGSVLPLNHEGAGTLLLLLPSASLGESFRTATVTGEFAPAPALILLGWAVVALLAARRWFTWK